MRVHFYLKNSWIRLSHEKDPQTRRERGQTIIESKVFPSRTPLLRRDVYGDWDVRGKNGKLSENQTDISQEMLLPCEGRRRGLGAEKKLKQERGGGKCFHWAVGGDGDHLFSEKKSASASGREKGVREGPDGGREEGWHCKRLSDSWRGG